MSAFTLGPNQLAWLHDLETTTERQAKKVLENGGFCCLGRACIVAEKNGIGVVRQAGRLVGSTLDSQPNVFEWLGLSSTCGETSNGSNTLIFFNDDGMPFKEIAAVIRANPELYFKESK